MQKRLSCWFILVNEDTFVVVSESVRSFELANDSSVEENFFLNFSLTDLSVGLTDLDKVRVIQLCDGWTFFIELARVTVSSSTVWTALL